MKLLAIDTSATACSVALLNDDEIHLSHELAPMQQSQRALPMIEALLTANHISLNQLNALAFGCGPGSFTGVRIAASVMQGLAYALDLPLIPISSLAAVAQAAYHQHGWKKILVAMDARISEMYVGAYVVHSNGLVKLQGDEKVLAPEKMIFPESSDWYGVGNAWEVYADKLEFKPLAIDATCLPMADAIAWLAKDKYSRQEWVAAEEGLPVYLRNDVAHPSHK